MAVVQILEKHYEGLSTDDKPTGVINGTTFRETDTRAMYITYDGTNWEVADRRVRLVNEDGSFIDLPGEFDDLITALGTITGDLSIIAWTHHSRSRVYPQDIEDTITLAGAGTANVFGSWTEIIPIDTVDFEYEVLGMEIEAADAATVYLIQLGYSIVDGSDPATSQILGERRVVLPTPITKAAELLNFHSQHCPANAKLWGRIKTAAGGSDEIEISVAVHRHAEVSDHKAHLETWPWST